MTNATSFDTFIAMLLVALLLIVAAVVVYFVYKRRRQTDNVASQRRGAELERFRTAVWASAIVNASSSMSAEGRGNEKVRVELNLEVAPPEGERYPVKSTWWVDPNYLHWLRPGDSVAIKIDRLDGMRVYPNVEWAEPIEWGRE